VYSFGPKLALPGSYVGDIPFHGDHASLTDAGLIGLDQKIGVAGRISGRAERRGRSALMTAVM
jgi:hypothetical protein